MRHARTMHMTSGQYESSAEMCYGLSYYTPPNRTFDRYFTMIRSQETEQTHAYACTTEMPSTHVFCLGVIMHLDTRFPCRKM